MENHEPKKGERAGAEDSERNRQQPKGAWQGQPKEAGQERSYRPRRDFSGPRRDGASQGPSRSYMRRPEGKVFNRRPRRKPPIPPAVKSVAEQNQLPVGTAFKIVRGEITLEQALADKQIKEERKQKAKQLCEHFPDINFALACLLVKDNITPEQYFAKKLEHYSKQQAKDQLKKQRMQGDNKQTPAFTTLAQYCTDKVAIELALYNQKFCEGLIKDFTPYEFVFAMGENTDKIHRLSMKYFCLQQDAAAIKKLIMIDKAILKKNLRPSHKAEGRYQFAEGVLQEKNEIILALHEGEIIRGAVLWSTPFDIMLRVGKYPIWVFRHAVIDCTQSKRPAVKPMNPA